MLSGRKEELAMVNAMCVQMCYLIFDIATSKFAFYFSSLYRYNHID